jgi:cytochrome P450
MPPEPHPILGHLALMRRNPLQFFTSLRRTWGDVVGLRFGWAPAIFVAHPRDIRRVHVDNVKNYDKQTPGFDKLRVVLGNGLLTSEGAFWLRQRRIAQPAFSRERVARFAPTMISATDELVDEWLRGRSSGAVDVGRGMNVLTLRIAGLTLLSKDFTGEARAVGDALALLLPQIQRTLLNPIWSLTRHIPTPNNLRVTRATEELFGLVRRTIEERRRLATPPDDLLTMLLQAKDEETGESMSDQQLQDEVLTIFLAGHETTANALTWALLLAVQHPDATSAVLTELERELGLGARATPPDAESSARLTKTRAFVLEAMRLFPPAWMVARRAAGDDELAGCFVPKNSLVFTSPYVTQRHPEFFPRPERFDPERFADPRAENVRAAYFPFGMGPRLCIGQPFAMLELVLLFARILQRVRLGPLADRAPRPAPHVTLRPDVPLQIFVGSR